MLTLLASAHTVNVCFALTSWLTMIRAHHLCALRVGPLSHCLRVPCGCRLRTYTSRCHQARRLYLRDADPPLFDGFDYGEPAVTPIGMAAVRTDGGIVHVVLGQSCWPSTSAFITAPVRRFFQDSLVPFPSWGLSPLCPCWSTCKQNTPRASFHPGFGTGWWWRAFIFP